MKTARVGLTGFACYILVTILLTGASAPAQSTTNCQLVINCPSNIVVTSCFNVQEFYNPTASNICCGVNSTVYCTPPSGSIFAVGTTTTVNCMATDCAQNTNFCSFTVTVLPGTNCATNYLQVQCPSNIVTTSCTNTQVFYNATVIDSACSNWTLTFSPPSGSFFAPGTTNVVDCFVTDFCGESNSCSFTVTVLPGTNCATNCITLACPNDIVLTTCGNCATAFFAATAANACCFNHVVLNYSTPSGSCFPLGTNLVRVTAYDPDCASTPAVTCSFTVTVLPGANCCSNRCCGPGLGTQAIQWLDLPLRQRLLPNPSGSNTSGTWIITNLPCYGNVLVVQSAPTNVAVFCSNGDFGAYHAISSFDLVPNTNGQFNFSETNPGPFGPYTWGIIPGGVEMGYEFPYFGTNSNLAPLPPYNVTFYFLDGQPNPCSLIFSAIGLAEFTTNTLSQPLTFRTEFDLFSNAVSYPSGPSSDTMLGGIYGPPMTGDISGTVIGSAFAVNGGDDFNTGWAIFQPTNALLTTNLPPGSGTDINGNPYPLPGTYPYLNVTVNHEYRDVFTVTLGYICCPCPCLDVQCPSNKTVPCGTPWNFDPPMVSSCCTNFFTGTTGPPTNILITPFPLVTNGACPLVDITETWFIQDACGASNFCSQTVTVLGCCSNACIELDCPADIDLTTCSNCVPVFYSANAVDNCCTNSTGGSGLSLAYNPPPGTCFYPGTTPVLVTATDGCGYSNSCAFNVTITLGTNCCTNTVTNIVLNTGYNPNSNNVYGFGQGDATWWVTKDPTLPPTTLPRPATVVMPNPAWMAAQSNSGWISSYATDADTLDGEYDFQTYFCAASDATNLVLSICLRADDAAAASLNGHLIPLFPANTAFSAPVPACGMAVNPSWFVYGGQNVLTVYVTNLYGVAMGLNAEASVSGSGLLPLGSPCCPSASGISGQKFYDLNCNGAQDPGEPGLSGWTIQLSNGSNVVTDITDVNGYYYFTNLPPGTYTVTEVQQAGWAQSAPVGGSYTVTLTNLQQIIGLNFGNCYTNVNTNCINLTCPSNIVVTSCSNCVPVFYTATAYDACCIQGPAGGSVTLTYNPPPGTCFQQGTTTVQVTATDDCSNVAACSFTVTVLAATNQCCGPGLGGQTINWLQFPDTNATALLPDPSGANTNGTWIITNLPCYGNVLMTQTFPVAPNILYWFLNQNFENVSNAYGTFKDMEAGYGPYSWGTFGSLVDFYNGVSTPITYKVNFYFLDGQPNPCTLYLAVVGLASSTTATVSQSVTFRGEYDLDANAPGGNGYASAYTSLNGAYPAAGLTGTNVGSAFSITTNFGDPVNTGWALLQPATTLATTTLPPGSGAGWPGSLTNVPFLSLTVTQQPGDGIGFTVGNVCCTPCSNACLQVECPSNKTVACGSQWTFDTPTAISCCTNYYDAPPGQQPTNVLLQPVSTMTNGGCPGSTFITQTWEISDPCGDTTNCSQTVTIPCCQTNTGCIQLNCPSNIVVTTCSNCVPVFYAATGTACCTNVLAFVYNPPSGSCFGLGTTVVQVTAFDCGLTTNCQFTVTVNPCTNCLVVDCPTNKTVECGTVWTFDAPTATSCCPSNVTGTKTNVLITTISTVTNGVCPKFATNIWSITDACGDSATCTQVVTIIDTTKPVINCPSNIVVVTLNSNCELVIPPIQVTATDNCTPVCDLKYTQSPTNGTIINGSSASVTVTVTDLCGNSNSCTVLVEGRPRAGLIVDWPESVTVTNCLVPCVHVIAHDCACPLQIPIESQSPPCGTPIGPGITSVTVFVRDCNGAFVYKVIPLVVTGQESFLGSLTNTGLNTVGGLLPNGAIDPHYFAGPVAGPPPGYVASRAIVINNFWSWLEIPHVSQWIAPTTEPNLFSCPSGSYTYTNQFTMPAYANPATASISGRWAADNGATALFINGHLTGNTIATPLGFASWTPFTISSGFGPGVNTITFVVTNLAPGASPTGLRVEYTNASVCATCAPPAIVSISQSQVLQAGSTAIFNVKAAGTPPLTYQWQFNGQYLAGATNSVLQITNVSVASAGLYTVAVGNPCGGTTMTGGNGQISLRVTTALPWPNAAWNMANPANPLTATYGSDLILGGSGNETNVAFSTGTTEDFGLPDPGGQIVNVMDINPQAGAIVFMPPVVPTGATSVSAYTVIMDIYEPDTSVGLASTLVETEHCCVSNLSSGGQDGLALTLDISNNLHITGSTGGVPFDYPAVEALPVDAWNRVALVVDEPGAGIGGSVSAYLNGIPVINPCICCIINVTNINWNNGFPTLLTAPSTAAMPNAEFYVSSIQFHAAALTPQMIAGIGSPDSGPPPVGQTLAGPSPVLTATLANGVVTISWPGTAYELQETTDLGSEEWAASELPFSETQSSGNIVTTAVAQPSTQGPAKFYRLVFRP